LDIIVKDHLAGIPLLEIEGELDHSSADVFERSIHESLNGEGALLLDLTNCSYVDSGGLAVMIWATRNLRSGGWLGVIGCTKKVVRLLEIVGLTADPAFRMFADVPAARHALNGC
jgi:anti-anti-sigma factor